MTKNKIKSLNNVGAFYILTPKELIFYTTDCNSHSGWNRIHENTIFVRAHADNGSFSGIGIQDSPVSIISKSNKIAGSVAISSRFCTKPKLYFISVFEFFFPHSLSTLLHPPHKINQFYPLNRIRNMPSFWRYTPRVSYNIPII